KIIYFFFFFQAEDGIRGFHVTGVQTCALPICTASIVFGLLAFNDLDGMFANVALYAMTVTVLGSVVLHGIGVGVIVERLGRRERSEERRVGKESTDRRAWGHDDAKENRDEYRR